MLQLPPRHGKQCAHDTPVLTTDGWKQHGELQVGDFVFTPSGSPTPVIALSGDTLAEFDVELSTGDVITVHGNHEWTVFDRRRPGYPSRDVETAKISGDVWIGPRGVRGGRARWQLPDVKPLEFDHCLLPLDPYTLGAWIGDGSTGKACLTKNTADLEVIVGGVVGAGFDVSATWVHNQTGVPTTSFGDGRLKQALKDCGCLTRKNIPEQYLRSSIEQRLQLLAGLMDTDGSVEPETGRCRYVTTLPDVRDGVFDLCATLGFRPYVTQQEAALSSSGVQGRSTVYTVGFQPTIPIPCRVERKRPKKFAVRRKASIVDVRPAANPRLGRCIQVADPSGLYLVGKSLQPTHNSRLASQEFVAWYLGNNPDKQIISVSAAGTLAEDFGREVRNRVQSPEYRRLFPGTKLAEDSQAKGRWHTDKGGIYYAVGIGGSVLGKGAHVAIVDDPFGSMADAMSEVERANVINWYRGTLYNRLMPGGSIILIGHRMHEDDLAGHLLQQQGKGGDKWTIVKMPAIGDGGQALWPEAYPIEVLERIKANTLPRDWSALYQQNPVPDDGTFFRREWFKNRYSVPPDLNHCRLYGGSDYATREGRGDWTVHVLVAVDPSDTIYVLDVRRMQSTTDVWIDSLIDLWKARAPHMPMSWAEPKDTINNALGPFLHKRMLERGVYIARQQYVESGQGKKDVRARAFQGRCAMGKVVLPERAPWLADFEAELFAFPNGKHDDQIDACALIGRHLDTMVPGHVPEVDHSHVIDDYVGGIDPEELDGWRVA